VENWEAENDVRSSRWHLTDCQFIQGEDSGNVPIGMWVCDRRTYTLNLLHMFTLQNSLQCGWIMCWADLP